MCLNRERRRCLRTTMTDNDWKQVIRLVVAILAVALAAIPAALALGLTVRVFL